MMTEGSTVFLSHNSRHKPAVEVIKGRLERKEPRISCWFDKDDLRSEGTWMSQLEDAVQSCHAAIVFIGPEGLGPVHQYEIDLLLKRAMYDKGKDALRLVVVLLPGSTEKDVRGFISLHMWADFRPGLDDEPALLRLISLVLGEAPSHGQSDDPLVPKPAIEPYRGLEPFQQKHAACFFGRDEEIRQLCHRLNQWPCTAVIGASGSGKSSLVRAGLQTELAQQTRPLLRQTTTVTVRPGQNPTRALAVQLVSASQATPSSPEERINLIEKFDQTLRSEQRSLLHLLESLFPQEDQHVLLVVDQFEELFTHHRDQSGGSETRSASDASAPWFAELLAEVAESRLDRLRIVITLRADFFDRCLASPSLKSLIENRTLLLGPLTHSALREVIEVPAIQAGASFEKGLVSRILSDVEDQNGTLPLLQHALKELWDKRRFGFLTIDAYESTGGVQGALKQRADAVFEKLSGPQQEIAKNVFLRLTTLGDGVADTRRRVNKRDLFPSNADAGEVDAVINQLSDQSSRLIVANDDGTVEVTHEALIRSWPRLRKWLDADRTGMRIHRHLTEAANEWASEQANPGHRDPTLLYTGARLAVAREFAEGKDHVLNLREREFLNSSIAALRRIRFQRAAVAVGVVSLLLLVAGFLRHMWNNGRNEQHAFERVEALTTSAIDKVPNLIQELEGYRFWATPLLRQKQAKAPDGSTEKLHTALALLPVESGHVDYLTGQLLTLGPLEFGVVGDALKPFAATIAPAMWDVATDRNLSIARRFRAACTLAQFDPHGSGWTEISKPVLNQMLGLDAAELVAWRSTLRPARHQLLEPLKAIFLNPDDREQRRTYATETLADYLSDEPVALFELLADAEPFQFPKLFGKCESHRDTIVQLCEQQRASDATADDEESRCRNGRRRSNAAVALLKLGVTNAVWTILGHSPDPTARTYTIHRLSLCDVDPQLLLQRFERESDVFVRSAILLALGEFSEEQLPVDDRTAFVETLAFTYEQNRDAGLHSAAEWLLRRWGQTDRITSLNKRLPAMEVQLRDRPKVDPHRWYVNTQGQTFVILDAADFRMGSPSSETDRREDETEHLRQIRRTFALSTKEVTREEYQRFLAASPDVKKPGGERFSRDPDSPQIAVDWYDAARYCNWLSQQEGIEQEQWCYEPNGTGQYAAGMRPAPNFLNRTGYRLPTESEWEFACRSNTITSRHFGSDATLLPKYGWALENSPGNYARPTGRLKPNDFGLFDMLGNSLEWCHDEYQPYDVDSATEPEYASIVDDSLNRVLRGGSYFLNSGFARSANRNANQPVYRYDDFGFRPARTYR